jgi:hypothetical protein
LGTDTSVGLEFPFPFEVRDRLFAVPHDLEGIFDFSMSESSLEKK